MQELRVLIETKQAVHDEILSAWLLLPIDEEELQERLGVDAESMIQGVINTVSGLAEHIRSLLHFSAPDEGALADYESWMPDFMEGLAKGIEKNRGLVEKAVRDVASDIVISTKVNGMEYGAMDSPLSGGNMSELISGIFSAVADALAGFSEQQGNIVIPVYVGGTLLDELVVTAQARQNLRSGGR